MGREGILHRNFRTPRRAFIDINSDNSYTDGEPRSYLVKAIDTWKNRNKTSPYPRRRAVAGGVALTLAVGLGMGVKAASDRKNDCVRIGKPDTAAASGLRSDSLCTALNNGPKVLWTYDLDLYARK